MIRATSRREHRLWCPELRLPITLLGYSPAVQGPGAVAIDVSRCNSWCLLRFSPIMIGKGLKDYIIIRTAIFGLRLIAPASLVYLASSIYRSKFLFSAWLGSYAIAEAVFYLCVYLPRKHLMQKVSKSRSKLQVLLYSDAIRRPLSTHRV